MYLHAVAFNIGAGQLIQQLGLALAIHVIQLQQIGIAVCVARIIAGGGLYVDSLDGEGLRV